MEGALSAFILLFILVSIWAFTTWRKLKNTEELKECVAWCVCEDDSARYNLPLWAYIKNAQIHCSVSDKYRISSDEEWDYVKTIISVFQKQLGQSFFYGAISHKKTIFDIPKEEFFIFRLFCFLSEHEGNGRIFGQNMFEKQISHKSYGMWGGPLYDAVYELSEFGRVFKKLSYITYLSCKASFIYKDEIAGWLTPEYFTEDLDSNQVRISSR